TRISHARGNVILGELPRRKARPYFNKEKQRVTHPVNQKHPILHESLDRLREIFNGSPFNQYAGPEKAELIIMTCGSGWLYAQEAVELTGLDDMVGILKIGTTWPLPEKLILEYLKRTEKVLFVEEVDPFLEGNVKELAADFMRQIGPKTFFGKKSHHIPFFGEMNSDRVVDALTQIFDMEYTFASPAYEASAKKAETMVPNRVLGFCPGCPHRASLWSIKSALELDDREGFVTGDIGCYALARNTAGYELSKTSGAMGTGTGLASGFGKLSRFGFKQPIISLCGDSTFFHAALPALTNAHFNNSNFIMVILDNSATAMTGFQPHPGVGINAMGETVLPVEIEGVCQALEAKVEVTDPFDLEGTRQKLLDMLEHPAGAQVLIMRRKCALLRLKEEKPPYRMHIDAELCLGKDCGCNRFCTRTFKCPGLIVDQETGKAKIDEVICVGCGLCAEICPTGAIVREETA
ncbi:MAG: 4Fe-4S binding protein, partial [Deltaproteobacteria bacterium]|nr:4Fe-4S binding protein [Deltaproteobacteria bacterium]